ncbi:alpha/beta fold hydrolase [Catenuloplanes atrovinosus]|uniref:Pimeloyl-ACP methyl ester carboxylesterase n=1 Tax=Catenuloplanes atrovinosus TaxID=137266 RepID=A0AAE3YL91_9ACTN|nr:alpha/beta hydrolase [Catenuloplanes atrovinosus]MDR7275903.1 pimeloyl-ACP methyl ester carboxylesterase [Catenuloplanes atrovinosus]
MEKKILYTREWGSGDRVAVLIHGMITDSTSWHEVGPALAEKGYRVIAPDLPGHGRSPAPDGGLTLGDAAELLLRTVPAEPELAIGHSLGGVVLAAAVERLRPARAVYVDPPQRLDDGGHGLESAIAYLEKRRASRTPETLRRDRPSWPERDALNEVEAALRWDTTSTATLLASAVGRDLAPVAVVPSLLIRADPSEYVPDDAAVDRLTRAGLTVRTMAGAGHTVWYGRLPDFLSALDGWI